jgi:hypothetical protein
MVTQAVFDKIEGDTIFAWGVTENSPEGVYMTSARVGELLQWVAVKGGGDDWAIYCIWHPSHPSIIARDGEKVASKDNIKRLVVAEDSVYKKYRL